MSRHYIFQALKAHLKARRLTYSQLAQALDLSETTVKRMFVTCDCTLDRLEQICQFLQVDLVEVVKSTPRNKNLINQLTQEQEAELVSNKELLLCAVCVMNLWTFEDMLSHLKISEAQCIQLMKRLEVIGFLELHSGCQYRMRVARDFSWIVGGPIMNMVKKMADEYFDHRFDRPGEVIKIVNVRIAEHSAESLKRRLELLAQEYADQVSVDAHLPLLERTPMAVCIAVRQWVPGFMHPLIHFPTASRTDN